MAQQVTMGTELKACKSGHVADLYCCRCSLRAVLLVPVRLCPPYPES